jgi:outer membrane protein TolC
MRKPIRWIIHFSKLAAILFLGTLIFANCVLAQGAPPASQQQGTQANPLPLSGRIGQNGSVKATQAPVPGTTTSVDTINPTVQVQGPYAGSTSSTAKTPFSGTLSLRDAIQRGLEYNLGTVGMTQAERQAHGQSISARSALLPNVNGTLGETVEQEDLKALGLRVKIPIAGFTFPTIVGPFNYFDLRAHLTQNVLDLTALNNYRAANETVRANQFAAQDARDLVVLAVGGAYLQVIAAKARVASAHAQLDTANALYQQTLQKHGVGLVAQIDVDRSEVEALTQRQRLLSLENDLSKQKINLARMTGLPPNEHFDVSDDVPFSAAPPVSEYEALKQALDGRSDLKSLEAQVQAAERGRSAAKSELLPSLSVAGDYGVIGTNPAQSHGTFTAAATLRVPIWQGGRAKGDIEQADAALVQRRAELEDLKSQVESDIREAYLDVETAASQVEVAQRNIHVTEEALDLTRQRYEAGVTDNVEVVQSQEFVTTAKLDYINSVFAHNAAKLSLARAMGRAADSLPRFLNANVR